jgi:hypothetical protein
MTSGSLLAQVHLWAAVAVVALAASLVIGGVLEAVGVLRGQAARRWLDRLILALLVAAAAAALVGPLLLLVVGPPRDWLHVVYAGVAIGAAPLARLEAARRGATRYGRWVAVGGLVTLAALLRLWGTGG